MKVQPALLDWACRRNRVAPTAYARKFPRVADWMRGQSSPTLREIEAFAHATHTPVGYLFLQTPPVEGLPVEDFRTVAGRAVSHPSVDLLDTVYACQQRQDWYREFARRQGDPELSFVSSVSRNDDIIRVAAKMRRALGSTDVPGAGTMSADEALRSLVAHVEDVGVLVMRNGVVGNNTRRKLDVSEFRGFALADPLAPVIFVNAADSKAAQIFTIGHELAHLWLGATGVSNAEARVDPKNDVERWCNAVAAEFLLPLAALGGAYDTSADPNVEARRLARRFRVSALVALRRMRDAGGLTRARFDVAYAAEVAHINTVARDGGEGGNFYRMTAVRTSKRFARAMILSACEGQTSFTDAFRLLGLRKMETFRGLGASLDVSM